jgi:DNA-binding Xre family transcriptional regulator
MYAMIVGLMEKTENKEDSMDIQIRLNLKHILISKGITQKELSQMTGIREAAISAMCNNYGISINKEHISLIIKALKINDMNEIIQIIIH